MFNQRRNLKTALLTKELLISGTGSTMDGPGHPMSRDNPLVDLKYVTFGFSFLQDAVERALIELATGQKVTTGLLAQQEPYPCTVTDR